MTEPRHHTPRNLARPSNGAGVAMVAQAKGQPLLPWQRDAADVITELDPETGFYWYGLFLVTVQRQAGKTFLEGNLADHRCLTTARGRVWLTMQNGQTAANWMREEHFTALAMAADVLGPQGSKDCAYSLSRRAGEVGVRWPITGATFLTFPPKRDALHSKQSDLVLVDEAWVHDADAGADLRQAIRPTMATRKGAQLGVLSTLGDDTSHYLDHYLDLARAQVGRPDARVALIDYGLEDDDDPEDMERIAARHPAYGHTIDLAALRDARADFGTDVSGWARAYGNRATRSRRAAIDPDRWAITKRARREVPTRAGIGVDVTPAGDQAAITGGWRADQASDGVAVGDGFVEPIYVGASTRATVDLLVQLARVRRAPLVADRASFGAVELLEAVQRKAPEVSIQLLSMGEYAAACATFYRGVLEDTQHHPGDPALDDAVAVATKRPLGDGGFGWGRKGATGSIAALVSATVAMRAWDTLPPLVERPYILT